MVTYTPEVREELKRICKGLWGVFIIIYIANFFQVAYAVEVGEGRAFGHKVIGQFFGVAHFTEGHYAVSQFISQYELLMNAFAVFIVLLALWQWMKVKKSTRPSFLHVVK